MKRGFLPWLLLTALLLALFLWRESGRPPLEAVESAYRGWVVRHAAPDPRWTNEVVVIGIDAAAMELQPIWPWPPIDMALFLRACEDHGVAAIGLVPEVDPDAGEQTAYRSVLMDRLLRTPRVVLNAPLSRKPSLWNAADSDPPFFLPVIESAEGASNLEDFLSQEPAIHPELRYTVPLGATHPPTEGTREEKVPLVYRLNGRVVPSFATQVVRLSLGVAGQDLSFLSGDSMDFGTRIRVPVDEKGTTLVDGRLMKTVLRIPYLDLLLAARNPGPSGSASVLDSLRGRTVLLGRTDAAAQTRTGPSGEQWTDVEFQAVVVSLLLNRAWVRPIPAWVAGLVLTGGLLLVFLTARMRPVYGILLCLATAAAYAQVTILLFGAEGFLLPALPALAFLAMALTVAIVQPQRVTSAS